MTDRERAIEAAFRGGYERGVGAGKLSGNDAFADLAHHWQQWQVESGLLALPDPIREAARYVDRAHRSFRESVVYQPPESLWEVFREKLAGPLERLRAALKESERE